MIEDTDVKAMRCDDCGGHLGFIGPTVPEGMRPRKDEYIVVQINARFGSDRTPEGMDPMRRFSQECEDGNRLTLHLHKNSCQLVEVEVNKAVAALRERGPL